MPRVITEKFVGDSQIARDQEGFGERPHIEVEQVRELILGLDAEDNGGDWRFSGKLLGDVHKEGKVPEEKAMRRFGLGTREIVVSGKLESDEEAGTGTYEVLETPAMCSQLPQQTGHGQYQHGAKSNDEFLEKKHDRSFGMRSDPG